MGQPTTAPGTEPFNDNNLWIRVVSSFLVPYVHSVVKSSWTLLHVTTDMWQSR